MSAQTQTGLSGFIQRLIAPLRRRELAPNGEPLPSTLPSPPAAEIDQFRNAVPEWLARDDFANLMVLLRYATNGAWAFALYNDVETREMVMEAARPLLSPLPIFEWTWTPEAPYPMAYLDRMTQAQRKERAIVFVFDFERAGDDVWKMLDYNREALADHPHGLVFWISPAGRTNAQRRAPHFWAQRAGVFDFTTDKVKQPDEQRQQTRDTLRDEDISLDSRKDLERQLRLTQGLLDEVLADPAATQSSLADLHLKLARLLYYAERYPEARTHASVALPIYKAIGDRLGEANTQKALGDLAMRDDNNLNEARDAYLAALTIYKAFESRLGEANTRRVLGDLALRDSNLNEARDAYLAALPIYKAIGARLGEANTQRALGDLALHEGNIREAQDCVEYALTIYKTIGTRLGEAGSYMLLGRITQEDAWFEQALALFQKINSRYYMATDRFYWGLTLSDKGDKKAGAAQMAMARDLWHEIGMPQYAQMAEQQRQRMELQAT